MFVVLSLTTFTVGCGEKGAKPESGLNSQEQSMHATLKKRYETLRLRSIELTQRIFKEEDELKDVKDALHPTGVYEKQLALYMEVQDLNKKIETYNKLVDNFGFSSSYGLPRDTERLKNLPEVSMAKPEDPTKKTEDPSSSK